MKNTAFRAATFYCVTKNTRFKKKKTKPNHIYIRNGNTKMASGARGGRGTWHREGADTEGDVVTYLRSF